MFTIHLLCYSIAYVIIHKNNAHADCKLVVFTACFTRNHLIIRFINRHYLLLVRIINLIAENPKKTIVEF